ncbi:MAG: hypothetical protein LAO30_11345 [Acidobacteriia bacterium]|nr:hypothetical protein [Terriglobia bacterium]
MQKVEAQPVFLNIPYDKRFERLYLAYITALSAMGFLPQATLGIAGNRRLDRIASLIESCSFSIHDLSRVQLDRNPPSTPRFNMPLELGLAVAWARANPQHKWFVFESMNRRLAKSMSDLDGTDPYIHDGTVRGVMREVCNAFVSPHQPTVPQMMKMYRDLRRGVPKILHNAGTRTLFTARVFSDLCVASAGLRSKYVRTK